MVDNVNQEDLHIIDSLIMKRTRRGLDQSSKLVGPILYLVNKCISSQIPISGRESVAMILVFPSQPANIKLI